MPRPLCLPGGLKRLLTGGFALLLGLGVFPVVALQASIETPLKICTVAGVEGDEEYAAMGDVGVFEEEQTASLSEVRGGEAMS